MWPNKNMHKPKMNCAKYYVANISPDYPFGYEATWGRGLEGGISEVIFAIFWTFKIGICSQGKSI